MAETKSLGSRRWGLVIKFIGAGVLASLLPIAVSAGQLWIHNGHVELVTIIGRGQIYLICAGITGGGLGELLCCGLQKHIGRQCAGFAAFLLFGASVWFYAVSADGSSIADPSKSETQPPVASSANETKSKSVDTKKKNGSATESKETEADRVARMSVLVLLSSVIVGGLCIIMSEE